jgi:hypothetical protein
MVTDTTTQAYFELCDSAYNTWKAYTQSYIQAAKPYWETLRK